MVAKQNEPIFREEDLPALTIPAYYEQMCLTHGATKAFTVVLPKGSEASTNFTDNLEMTRAMAAYLREELGLKEGDVVGLQSPNCLTYPIIAQAILMAGLILTNINPLYTPKEVHHQLTDAKVKVLFVLDLFGAGVAEAIDGTDVQHVISGSLVDLFPPVRKIYVTTIMRLKRAIPKFSVARKDTFLSALKKGRAFIAKGVDVAAYTKNTKAESIALYQYTGGTTGKSKGAMLTHKNLISNLHQLTLADPNMFGEGTLENKNVILMLPLYHVYAFLFGILVAPTTGSHVILIPSPRPMSNVRIAMERYPPVILPALNTLFQNLLDEPWFVANPPKTLMHCVSGAAALSKVIADKFEALVHAPILEGYGMTESTAVLSFSRSFRPNKFGTVGLPIPGTELKLMKSDGEEAEQGERGEIWAKGPQIMAGYLNRTDATKDTLQDGWLKTGDVGIFDEDGELRIVDRVKDMIIVSGFNVYPTEIEEALVTHPKIAEATVVGILDDHAGERPVACVVVTDSSLTKEDVITHCRKTLTGYKIPKDVIFVKELPKSPVGKVLRRILRDQVRSGEIT